MNAEEDPMMTTTGAQRLIQLLQEQGVLVVAGIPGGNILPFYDALHGSPITHILARHEQGAAFIAQGMARSTGRPGVCLATSGPGATNLLTGIADAWRDSVPIIAITGQVPRHLIGTSAFQEIDIVSMAKGCTKATFQPMTASELDAAVRQAFAIALEGRPGPVLIDIPKDVFLEPCRATDNAINTATSHHLTGSFPKGISSTQSIPTVREIAYGNDAERCVPSLFTCDEVSVSLEPMQQEKPVCHPDAHALLAAARMIQDAERPLLYIGGGIIHAEAAEALRDLAQRADLPVTGTLMSIGAMPADDPRWLGMLGMHGTPCANLALQRADLLIVAGARFDDRATGTLARFAPQAKVIHIDTDAQELGRLRAAECSLHGDARIALQALSALLPHASWPDWHCELATLRAENPLPEQVAHAWIADLAAEAGPDCICTTDVGQHQMWAAQAFPAQRPRQFLTSGGLGTMGFGLPAAIGASIAYPERTVLCISGDGSILMNLQELATLSELGCNVKVCILNNGALGMVRQQQTLLFGKRHYACEFLGSPDFSAIAKGFGIPALRVEQEDMAGSAWRELLQQPGPALLDFAFDPEELVWPMVPAGKSNAEMLLPTSSGLGPCVGSRRRRLR